MMLGIRDGVVAARFFSKVGLPHPGTGCMEWLAGVNKNSGYGAYQVGDKQERAHRVAYSIFNGDIPGGLIVRHRCDNRLCCAPDHLEIGTHSDNAADRRDRGRYVVHTNGNERKTHCKRGHAFTPANTYRRKTGRACRTCQDMHKAAHLDRRKARTA